MIAFGAGNFDNEDAGEFALEVGEALAQPILAALESETLEIPLAAIAMFTELIVVSHHCPYEWADFEELREGLLVLLEQHPAHRITRDELGQLLDRFESAVDPMLSAT